MIRLIALNNPRMGQAFIDYMASRKIRIQMSSDGDGQFSLWLLDDSDQIEAEAELQLFLSNPNDSKYQQASWDVGNAKNLPFRYASPDLFKMIRQNAGGIVLGVMGLGIVVFLMTLFGFEYQVFSWLHFPADGTEKWQVWRWFSHALLHFSLLHIVFNMLWWWALGGPIEKRLGSGVLASIFLISAAGSGLVQYWVEGFHFGGLSGVVYALVGFLWIFGALRPEIGVGIQKPILIFMLIWLVLAFVQPFFAIANSAHLGGLIIGMALGWYEARRIKTS